MQCAKIIFLVSPFTVQNFNCMTLRIICRCLYFIHYSHAIMTRFFMNTALGRVHNCIRARVKVLMCGSVVQN